MLPARLLPAALLVSLMPVAAADRDTLLTVSQSSDSSVFLELGSSGRKNIAASNERVGVVWEQIDAGKATVFAAFKTNDQAAFDEPVRLSENDAASPVIAYCDERFYLAWIDDGQLRVSISQDQVPPESVTVAGDSVNELSIGCADNSALVAFSKRVGPDYAIYVTRADKTDTGLAVAEPVSIAPLDKYRFQTNPGVAYSKERIVVTWHDRTSGTNLLYATSGPSLDTLPDQVQINELIQKSYEWGSGSSAIRNAITVGKKQRLVVTWLDKRASRSGYKVYSAFSDSGGLRWSDNYKISDEWGDIVPAWTPAIASDGKRKLRVVWMDTREDENALWYSNLSGMSWSQDYNLASTSEGASSPVIAYSPDGRFHAAWIQKTEGKETRIVYFSK